MRSNSLIYISMVIIGALILSFPINNIMHKFILLINAGITTIELFAYKGRPFSMHKIVNLFILFFFIIANSVQYVSKNVTSSIYYYKLDDLDYLKFQFLVLVIIILFNTSYRYIKMPRRICSSGGETVRLSSRLLIGLSLISFAFVLYMNRNDLSSLFLRGVSDSLYVPGESDTNVAGMMVFSVLFKSTPFSCFVLAAIYNLPQRTQWILFFILFLDFFPTGVARMAVASVYLPILIIKCRYLWRPNVFILFMIFGLLVIFPFLNIFRYIQDEYSFEYSLDFLNSMHFDASHEFMIIIKENIITYGYQLLGCFFFWVPRSIWAAKPEGSSAMLANKFGEFPNISMPFFAEGYINFGYIGIIIFTIFLAFVCSRMDFKFWQSRTLIDRKRFSPFYYFIISQLMLTLRGDLMSGTAYIIGGLFNLYLIYKIAPYLSKKLIRRSSRCNYNCRYSGSTFDN